MHKNNARRCLFEPCREKYVATSDNRLMLYYSYDMVAYIDQGHREFPNGNSQESRYVQIPAGIPGNFRLSTFL